MPTTTPELPREYFVPTGVPSTSVTKTVGPSGTSGTYDYSGTSGAGLGAALQSAINASSPGWNIVLTTRNPDTLAALKYQGPIALKVHSPATTTWTVLTTDNAESGALVRFGYRVDPSDTALMPSITTNENNPALHTDWNYPTNTIGGHYWYICGVHFYTETGNPLNNPLFGIGCRGGRYAWLSTQVAHHIVVDRCWFEGRAGMTNANSRGVVIVGHHIAVVNSYVRGFGTNGQSWGDAQGVHIAKGIGRANYNGDVLGSNSPVHIENNFIEAEHESMNTGGDFINLNDLTEPEVCDVTYRGNFITKDLKRHPCAGTTLWPSSGITYDSTMGTNAKNLFEVKHGNRLLIEGNHFRSHWMERDQKYQFVLNVRPHDQYTY